MERLRDEGQVVAVEHEAGAAQRLGHRARAARDYRHPVGERLDQRRTEALVHRHRQIHVRAAIPRVAGLGRDRAGEEHPADSDPRDEHLERVAVALEARLGPDDDEGRLGRAAALVERERLDHVLEPLVRDDPADGQHDRLAVRLAARHLARHSRSSGTTAASPSPASRRSAALKLESAMSASARPSEPGERCAAAIAEIGQRRVEVAEQLSRGDVVVAERGRPVRAQADLAVALQRAYRRTRAPSLTRRLPPRSSVCTVPSAPGRRARRRSRSHSPRCAGGPARRRLAPVMASRGAAAGRS